MKKIKVSIDAPIYSGSKICEYYSEVDLGRIGAWKNSSYLENQRNLLDSEPIAFN